MRAYIVTHEAGGRVYSNGYLIPDNYDHSVAAFLRLARWAAKRFPDLKLADIECRTVTESRWCKGCPIIRFPLPAGTAHSDFTSCRKLQDVIYK